jgi:hypothetical protein
MRNVIMCKSWMFWIWHVFVCIGRFSFYVTFYQFQKMVKKRVFWHPYKTCHTNIDYDFLEMLCDVKTWSKTDPKNPPPKNFFASNCADLQKKWMRRFSIICSAIHPLGKNYPQTLKLFGKIVSPGPFQAIPWVI